MFLLQDDYWEIRTTEKKGRGLFAKKEIPPGSVIGDYLGRVIRSAEESQIDDSEHFYLMYYHDRASIFPDLKTPGIHLLNHSCTPNCWMYTYKGHTLFFALRRIFPGEELTITYLLSPQDKYCNPCTHLCSCGSAICNQTMHLPQKKYDEWSKHHEKEAAKTKRKRVYYGKNLQRLSSYPENIPDNPIYTLFGAVTKKPARRNDEQLPDLQKIRALIRETGRQVAFPTMNLRILGVSGVLLISETFS